MNDYATLLQLEKGQNVNALAGLTSFCALVSNAVWQISLKEQAPEGISNSETLLVVIHFFLCMGCFGVTACHFSDTKEKIKSLRGKID